MTTTELRSSIRKGSSIAIAFAKAALMDELFRLGTFVIMVVALIANGVYSQSLQDAQRFVPRPSVDPSARNR
jgi:hypothetical protein